MDLFDQVEAVAQPATEPDEWDAIAIEQWEPSDAELEAQFCGQERAGLPSVSKAGLTVRARWRAYLEAQPAECRADLERIEEESYRAARRRIVLTRGLDAEEIPE